MNLSNYFTDPKTPIFIYGGLAILTMLAILYVGYIIVDNINYKYQSYAKLIINTTAFIVAMTIAFKGIGVGFDIGLTNISNQLEKGVSATLFDGEEINVVKESITNNELIVEYNDVLYRIEYENLNDGRKLYKKNEVDVDDESITIGE